MPNHKSAEKRDRQNAKRKAVNTTNRTRLRGALKKIRTVVAGGQKEEAQTLLPQIVSIIDKSVKKGVLHRNAAARHKSRLSGHVKELLAK